VRPTISPIVVPITLTELGPPDPGGAAPWSARSQPRLNQSRPTGDRSPGNHPVRL